MNVVGAFYPLFMAMAQRTDGGEVARLRAQLDRAQGRRVRTPPLPTHPLIAALLPEGGLRPGETYAVSDSASLLLALLAPVSRAGSWCAAVGMPTLGTEAAESAGIALERLVLVPDPGPRWLAVTAAIAEVMPIVALRPPGRVADADVARLSARLRDRGAVLLVQGAWPQAQAMLSLHDPAWTGVGNGHGCLTQREATVTVSSRRFPVPRSTRLLLPDPAGVLAAPRQDSPAERQERPAPWQDSPAPRLRAVG